VQGQVQLQHRGRVSCQIIDKDQHDPTTKKGSSSIHLLSLQWSDSKKQVKQVWKWKDTVLGDGRDFFVPKPKTLTALNHYIITKVEQVQECSIVSNCARFELLLLVDDTCTMKSESQRQDFTWIEQALSQCLLAQVESHASQQGIANILFNFDNPNTIDPNANSSSIDIDLEWTHLSQSLVTCLLLLLEWPRGRIDRDGPFPFDRFRRGMLIFCFS
jgi:hypothetical protein